MKDGEIRSEKILIKDIFKMWFRIPEYQRPYVWSYEEIHDLLDDLTFACREKPNSEYFLGSFVFQFKPPNPELGIKFEENDLLDGQQRLTTLLLLMGVIRDLTNDQAVKDKCQTYIYQKADPIENIPERTRIVFPIRESAQTFIHDFIKKDGGTNDEKQLKELSYKSRDVSVRNMANAVLEIRKFFTKNSNTSVDSLLPFIANKVLMIYVATENLEDAFRLFMILNDRGVPLRNSDILKSMNLGALDNEIDKIKYAKLWEEAEGELGDDFDRFLQHIRSILVKEKARMSLLQEFEYKIYNPREKEKNTGNLKPALLKKGKDTFELIKRYLNHYRILLSGQNDDKIGDYSFDNLIKVMMVGLPATDWMPPLLRYFDKFRFSKLLDFTKRLDNKFSSDWIAQYSPTYRIEAMNAITRKIEDAQTVDDVINSNIFDIDKESFMRVIQGDVYGKRFARYILLKLDYYYQNHSQKMHFETLSVEHILPQNPPKESQWNRDFSENEIKEWVHKIGNLVLITRRKNSSLGNLDYATKVAKYFQKNIDACPNSLRILKAYSKWTITELKDNHKKTIEMIKQQYGIK